MIQIFIEPLLHIVVILPFLLWLMNKRDKINYLRVWSIAVCYYTYSIALSLPKLIDSFNFINSRWNWDGKICGIVCCITLYFIFRKLFNANNFFTFKQNSDGVKSATYGAIIIVVVSTIVWSIFVNAKFNIETLLFQISLPGIDEELMFRGVLLGLMCCSLRTTRSSFCSPSIILNAILFGLMHALTITYNSVNFDPIYFVQTGAAGYVWGWITIKSRSVLLAVISHNLSNFFGTFATMVK